MPPQSAWRRSRSARSKPALRCWRTTAAWERRLEVQERKVAGRNVDDWLDPLESTLLVRPDISDRQDRQKHGDFRDTKPTELAIPNRPREQEDGLHVEDYEQDGDDIETHRVPAAGIAGRLDAAFIGFQLGDRGRGRAD